MHVMNTGALSQQNKSPENCPLTEEKEKKREYLEACLQQHCHFSPFVISVHGLLVVEAGVTLKQISRTITTKWKHPYSRVCGYVKGRMAITLVRATHCYIQGSQVPTSKIR